MDLLQNPFRRRDNAADHIKESPTTPQKVYDLLVDNPIMLGWLLLLTALCLVLYLTRNRLLSAMNRFAQSILPGHLYQRLPNTFQGDIEAGLTSSNFDLTGNMFDGDSRAGLDDESKAEVLRIMKRERCTFDEARRKHVVDKLAKNGIGPDGRPLDPRAVFFS